VTNPSRFLIQNDLSDPLIVNIEPECVQVSLSSGEKVTVYDAFNNEPVTLKVDFDNGETIISVWPGDGEVRVEKDGVDVFDLLENSEVRAKNDGADVFELIEKSERE
jgi:hypothetical protein